MYKFLQSQNNYQRWGRYFPTVPAFPVEEEGMEFRFAWATNASDAMDDLVANFEHHTTDETIKTPANTGWSLDGAVLIDGELYKIIDHQSRRINSNASALVKTERKEYTVRLKKISNPIGLGRRA